MKIGLVSAILDGWDFEEMTDICSDMGFNCVEVACWPKGDAERRYAGVSHIDVNNTSEEYINHIKSECKKKNIEISALAFYPNTLDGDLEKRKENILHLKKVIKMSALLGVNMVTTFIGRDHKKSVEENLDEVRREWPDIMSFAQENNVRIAIENCPMLFDKTQWPGGQNLFTSPYLWKKIFEILPYENLGINFDPSHFVWQQMDYMKPIYEFKDKIFHIHFKDIKLYKEKLEETGVLAYPLLYMAPKIPGLGDVRWDRFCSALTDIGYKGAACIEIEDRAFEENRESVLNSIRLSKRFLENFAI